MTEVEVIKWQYSEGILIKLILKITVKDFVKSGNVYNFFFLFSQSHAKQWLLIHLVHIRYIGLLV